MNKEKADIILLQPPGWASQNPPLGLAMLKSYLAENKLAAKAADLNIILYNLRHGPYAGAWDLANGYYTWERESSVKRMFEYYSEEITDFIYSILSREPRAVGFSAHCSSIISARLLAAKFKQFAPEIKVVFGGPHVAPYGAGWEGLLRSNSADAVVFGEGEQSLTEYLKAADDLRDYSIKGVAYKGSSGQIINGGTRNLIKSLDSLPFADFSDFDLGLYAGKRVLPTYFSRGCVNKCIYCTENKFFPLFRNRSGQRVFDEIMHQTALYPETTYFRMHDSVSNGNIAELGKFCDLMAASGRKLRFNLENAIIRKEMDAGFYRKLRESGCDVIGYGLETPSKTLLKSVGKGACLDADFDKVVEEGARARLPIGINMMFGLPGETDEDFQSQLDFLERHRRNSAYITINPALNFCYFPEGSAAHSEPARYGIDMSLGELYWSSVDRKNTFPHRLEKFERFCALAHKLGHRNIFDVTQTINKQEMLGNYYYKLGDFAASLRHLRRSFEAEVPTLEIAMKILEIYEKSALPKDDFHVLVSDYAAMSAETGNSWLESILTRRELAQAILCRPEGGVPARLRRFFKPGFPKIVFSVRGAKNLVKYVLALAVESREKRELLRKLSAGHENNRAGALEETKA